MLHPVPAPPQLQGKRRVGALGQKRRYFSSVPQPGTDAGGPGLTPTRASTPHRPMQPQGPPGGAGAPREPAARLAHTLLSQKAQNHVGSSSAYCRGDASCVLGSAWWGHAVRAVLALWRGASHGRPPREAVIQLQAFGSCTANSLCR